MFKVQGFSIMLLIAFVSSFLMGAVMDHRDVVLHAVKTRYDDERLHNASMLPVSLLIHNVRCHLVGC